MTDSNRPNAMNKGPLRHDYTSKTRKGGWAIVDFDFLSPGMAKVTGFGLKRNTPHQTLEQAYLLPGEELVISMPDGEVLYQITALRYERDPYDMYHADLKYVQHLTGLRIVAQRDPEQRARQIEWGRQYHDSSNDNDRNA